MAISIYTSRIVLKALGINDYGIYNVVGGFVSMFSILSSSLINASQRFISFEMGRIQPQLGKIFSNTLTIHVFLALIIFFIIESFGFWLLNSNINIIPERLSAANWVFHCSAITFCINIINIPFTALIIAHERMSVFAFISLFEAGSKLGIVYLLLLVQFDKLIVYALLMTLIALSLSFIYVTYCRLHFEGLAFSLSWDSKVLASMLSFSGWNFIGSSAGILSTHGINILINIFFGVSLNAARGVAEQVNTAINSFVSNFMTALNPQITKSYASGNFNYMNDLMIKGAKYATLLFWLISLTIFVEADYILGVWLVEVPDYSVIFLRLIIVYSIFQALSYTLYVGMLATGHIKRYQIVIGTITASSFVICFFFFKMNYGPEWSYISIIITAFINMFVRLKLLEEIVGQFSGYIFLKGAIIKSFLVIIISTSFVYLVKSILNISGFYSFIITLLLSILAVIFFSYLFALDRKEKKMILSRTNMIYRRFFH